MVSHMCTVGLIGGHIIYSYNMASGNAMDLEDRGTGLAKAWEKDAEIRRRIAAGKLVTRLHIIACINMLTIWAYCNRSAVLMTEVKTTPNGTVDRTALELNERLIVPAILHLGSRVGVDTLELHVASLYNDVVQIAISGILLKIAAACCVVESHVCACIMAGTLHACVRTSKDRKRDQLPGSSKG